MQGTHFRSQVGELRSHMLLGQKKKKTALKAQQILFFKQERNVSSAIFKMDNQHGPTV